MKFILGLSFFTIAIIGVLFIWFLVSDSIKYYQKKKKRRMNNR